MFFAPKFLRLVRGLAVKDLTWSKTKLNGRATQTRNRQAASTCLPGSALLFFIPELRDGMSGVLEDLHTGSPWSAFTQTLSCHRVVALKAYMFTQHAHRGYSTSVGIRGHTGAPLLNPQWNFQMLCPAPFLIVNRLAQGTAAATSIPPQIISI